MIIISYGLPKSASTITFTYTEELLSASGSRSGQAKFTSIFPEGFVYRFGIINTSVILLIHLFYGSIVIKTHSAPVFPIRLLIGARIARATSSSRDPRDIILSAIDHGKTNSDNPFVQFTTVENTIPTVLEECKKWERWKKYSKALFIRYENISQNAAPELRKIALYLGLNVSEEKISEIVQRYESKKQQNKNFNKGTHNRYLTEMSLDEISLCNLQLGEYIQLLGYKL
ncbi:MAG: sulfotransferase domain-containing protein [Bacteroidota bacterium]|nr:sulfotransferase domain-containing protein [Bacteroidota bacterium]